MAIEENTMATDEAALQAMAQALIGDGPKGLRTLAEIKAGLEAVIPDVFLGSKYKGGTKLTIFMWTFAQDMLDWWAPGWQSSNTFTATAERVICNTRLCIPTSDRGIVCRDASGDDSEDDDEIPEFDLSTEEGQKAMKKWKGEQGQREYGSPTTRAEGQAFKRACMRFGLGMYLRRKHPVYNGPVIDGSDGAHRPSPQRATQPKQAAQTPPQEDENPRLVRFRTLWDTLILDFHYTKEQVNAQYALVGGREKFQDLSEKLQDAAIAKLDEMVAFESKMARTNKK